MRCFDDARAPKILPRLPRSAGYFRRPGFDSVAVPGLPWSPEFMAAYEAATKGGVRTEGAGAAKTSPGTVAALVVSLCRSLEFLNLKPITQRTCRITIEPFRGQHGDKTVAKLKREHAR